MRTRMYGRAIINLLALCLAGLALAGGSRESAAQTPGELSPYPDASPTFSPPGEEVTNYDFVLGAVERTGGAMRAKRSVRVAGQLDRLTLEIPAGISTDEVVEHYRAQLAQHGYRELFACRARDCGKSTVWANSVFGQAILYGPDRYQRYLAARRQQDADEQLVAIYVTQRGNRKVYAHIETIAPTASSGLGGSSEIVDLLERDGFALLGAVRPGVDGQLSAAAGEVLAEVGVQLAAAAEHGLYVVCHLYGSGEPEAVQRSSQQCAERARALLDPDDGLQLRAVGAGPYAPRTAERKPRLELVAP